MALTCQSIVVVAGIIAPLPVEPALIDPSYILVPKHLRSWNNNTQHIINFL